jgi:hypothetical protein
VRQDDAGGENSSLAALGGLSLDIAALWPLSLVMHSADLQQYNAVLAVLLQVIAFAFHSLLETHPHTATAALSTPDSAHPAMMVFRLTGTTCRYVWQARP